jgi:hypothetical protein
MPSGAVRPVPGRGRLDQKVWTPRELRHSFVSLLSANGVRIEDISRLVGHSASGVTERVYRHQLHAVLQEGATVMGVRPKLDGGRGHIVFAVGPVRGVPCRRIELRRSLDGVGLAVHLSDQALHVVGDVPHLLPTGRVDDRVERVPPGEQDQL